MVYLVVGGLIVFAIGLMLGFLLPSIISIYEITQSAYYKGYEAGRLVVRGRVWRAARHIDAGDPQLALKELNALCEERTMWD